MESGTGSLAGEGTLQACAIKRRVPELFDAEGCIWRGGDKHSGKTSKTHSQHHIRNASTCSGGRKPLRAVLGGRNWRWSRFECQRIYWRVGFAQDLGSKGKHTSRVDAVDSVHNVGRSALGKYADAFTVQVHPAKIRGSQTRSKSVRSSAWRKRSLWWARGESELQWQKKRHRMSPGSP